MTQTIISVQKLKINRLTKTQFEGATPSNTELYLTDPEFNGGKLLQTDANGDIVESTIDPTDVGTVKDVQVNSTSVVSSGVANIDLTGYELKGSVVALSATDSITIADNTYYTGGTQTALTVTVPVSGMDISFISQICFRSGATATTFTESAGDIVWDERSVDLVQGVFVPDVNKDYTVIIYYNGFSFVGIASSVANA